MLDVLDKELKSMGCKYVRYADDFSIYTKSKVAARNIGNRIFLFLRDKLKLPINRTKSGIPALPAGRRRPVNFKLLGHGFVPVYKKGVKGQYQLVVKPNSWLNFKRKLIEITKKTKPISLVHQTQNSCMINSSSFTMYHRLSSVAELWLFSIFVP